MGCDDFSAVIDDPKVGTLENIINEKRNSDKIGLKKFQSHLPNLY